MANQYLTVQQAQYLLEKWASEYVPNQNGILLNPTLNGSISIGGTPTFGSSAVSDSWRSALNATTVSYGSVTPANVSVANNSDATLCNTGSLSTGHYILLGIAYFTTTSTTGRRGLYFSSSNTGSALDRFSQIAVPPASGAGTRIQIIYIVNLSGTATYYLRAYQNSGNSMNVQGGIRYIKFA